MPLPWKKAGISRLVADHLNSAKQGASLVETGFPTSIVDLFVKNRDGLKRSTKNKKNHKHDDTESLAGDSSICDSFLDTSSCPASPPKSINYRGSFFSKTLAPSPTISRNPSFTCSYSPPLYGIESFDPVIVGDDDKIGVHHGKNVVAKKVFVGLMKVLFLIVLALGKKQFAIGITVSAFLLLVLEILGKFVCRLIKQCQSFKHFLEQVVCNPRSENEMLQTCLIEEDPSIVENQTDEEKEEEDDQEEQEVSKFPNYSIVPFLSHCRSLHKEWISGMITDEESAEETPRYINKNPKNRSRKIKLKIKKLWISKRKQEVDSNEEDEEEKESAYEEEKSKKNLKKEIKAKLYLSRGFKKIMPNKLKNISKKKPAFLRKKTVSAYDTIYDRIEEEANSSQVMDNLYEHESSASSSISDDDDNEIVLFNNEDVSDSSSDTSDDEIIEMVESPKKETFVLCEKETTMWTTKKTSFVCLIPIILVGLEGGRVWAIIFTLLCCLVWKLVRMSSKFFQILVTAIFDQM